MTATARMTGDLEPRSSWTATHCTIAKALDVVSNRSTFLLVREAFYGATRFDEFATRTGLSDPIVAARLKDLVAHGLLERQDYREPGQRTRPGYVLTEKGADLVPALMALMQWGDRWLTEDGGPVAFLHRDCGARVHTELRCTEGHVVDLDALDLADVRRTPRSRRRR